MRLRDIATLVAFCTLGLLAASSLAATPNIVFIFADDLGWTDTSVAAGTGGYSSDFYETPNLELLATNGMAFTNAYSAGANCAPTRAALLTGQYAPRATNNVFAVGSLDRPAGETVPLRAPSQGLPDGSDQIPGTAITLAETLQTAGYTTAHFGKYHVGDPDSTYNNGPLAQGFDYNFGGNGTGNPGSTYFADTTGVFASPNIGPELDPYASPAEHLTDATTNAALAFMADHTTGPFFMNVAYHAPHSPIDGQGRTELVDKYAAKTDGVYHNDDDYAALVEGVDEGVGRIVQYLNTTADPNHPGQMLAANTLIVFTSDNGGSEGATENAPLKGQKGEYSEGGIRVPLIVSQPGVVPTGTVNHTPVSTIDYYPTFAAVAGADLPADTPIDGEDLMPIFADESASLTRDSLFWHFPGYLLDSGRNQRPQSILRQDADGHQWKLLYNYEDESFELYDLATDLGETTNLATTETEMVDQLGDELRDWLLDVNAKVPTVVATGLPAALPNLLAGDLNDDGTLDALDWQLLNADLYSDLRDLPASQAYFRGDLNRDGWNNQFDFALFKQYYLAGDASRSLSDLVATVPEPSTLAITLLAVLGGTLSTSARRRRR
ncbi:sulfatase-like hydrolase/transferase [Aeoliella mucimassa]|uniref:Arylsulfatase n=1 Tax=Aeoliella mucimassa TaxID=2527972 RepID=A0A518AQ69_9BACT|nr:sulfatase-like hydrolase/transferase [Aeoliella mucimassa]QDU56866.1 Arylsulfatase [Aeoliella mucimassa]